MKISAVFMLVVLLAGCSGEGPEPAESADTQTAAVSGPPSGEGQREGLYERWSGTIGEQFWPFGLEEYALQEEEADIVRGPGGRWITARYLLREGSTLSREAMAERITRSFEAYGWKRADRPEGKYVLGAIYETAADDLHFVRGPFTSADAVLLYRVTVHLSEDAGVLVLYCEAGW